MLASKVRRNTLRSLARATCSGVRLRAAAVPSSGALRLLPLSSSSEDEESAAAAAAALALEAVLAALAAAAAAASSAAEAAGLTRFLCCGTEAAEAVEAVEAAAVVELKIILAC